MALALFKRTPEEGQMPSEAHPLDLEITRIVEALAPPRKPAGLVVAERILSQRRAERAQAAETLRDALGTSSALGLTDNQRREVRRLEGLHREADEAVRSAREELDAARAKAAPAYEQLVGAHAIAAEWVLLDLLERIEAVSSALTDAHDHATRNGAQPPRPISCAPKLAEAIRTVRKAMVGA